MSMPLAALLCASLIAPPKPIAAPDHFVYGDSVVVDGATVSAWARVNGSGKVIWVGTTMPASLADNLPEMGSGPAGAFAVLNFPPIVKQTTYFDHVEYGAMPEGHPTPPNFVQPDRYGVPHFDIHFYAVPVSVVESIPFAFNPDQPAPALHPAGYGMVDPVSIPQMGRHVGPASEAAATDVWQATMIAGFMPDASVMHFIEPMVTQELLRSRQNFWLPVPMPASLGRATRYPTEFVAQYDRKTDSYSFVFKGFVSMN